jgi:hypothetical protein
MVLQIINKLSNNTNYTCLPEKHPLPHCNKISGCARHRPAENQSGKGGEDWVGVRK